MNHKRKDWNGYKKGMISKVREQAAAGDIHNFTDKGSIPITYLVIRIKNSLSLKTNTKGGTKDCQATRETTLGPPSPHGAQQGGVGRTRLAAPQK